MFTPIQDFEGTRSHPHPSERVRTIKAAAEQFRTRMLAGPKTRYYEAFELVRIPYPSKYAYLNAWAGVSPFLHLVNRLFVIQFDSAEGVKTLLVSPMDWEHQRTTPFFARLAQRGGRLADLSEALITRKTNTVLNVLQQIGLRPEDVDYITYDHMHTVNVTRWLGAHGQPALLPNAKLLVMREEWECARFPTPWQAQWFCPGGLDGVPEAKVMLLDGDVALGDGSVALIRTKGHTEGNHSIVAHTDGGLLVTSENGVSLDAYAPRYSHVPGVAEYAETTGAEVVLNGNTLEYGVDQYLSMIQEKTIAGALPEDPRLPNMAPSSESDGFWLFPQTAPTFRRRHWKYGELVK